MTSRRWFGLAVAAVLAVSAIVAGASELAAAGVTRGNYRGPVRPQQVITHHVGYSHRSNYRGPVRTVGRASTLPGSNRPASASGR